MIFLFLEQKRFGFPNYAVKILFVWIQDQFEVSDIVF